MIHSSSLNFFFYDSKGVNDHVAYKKKTMAKNEDKNELK
jgi:hypothetical protein